MVFFREGRNQEKRMSEKQYQETKAGNTGWQKDGLTKVERQERQLNRSGWRNQMKYLRKKQRLKKNSNNKVTDHFL